MVLADYILVKVIENYKARIAELEAKLGIANTTVGVASEKERLLKSSASISRDGATREVATMTIYDEARKLAEQRGIELGDRRFMRILQEVENKRKSA